MQQRNGFRFCAGIQTIRQCSANARVIRWRISSDYESDGKILKPSRDGLRSGKNERWQLDAASAPIRAPRSPGAGWLQMGGCGYGTWRGQLPIDHFQALELGGTLRQSCRA